MNVAAGSPHQALVRKLSRFLRLSPRDVAALADLTKRVRRLPARTEHRCRRRRTAIPTFVLVDGMACRFRILSDGRPPDHRVHHSRRCLRRSRGHAEANGPFDRNDRGEFDRAHCARSPACADDSAPEDQRRPMVDRGTAGPGHSARACGGSGPMPQRSTSVWHISCASWSGASTHTASVDAMPSSCR